MTIFFLNGYERMVNMCNAMIKPMIENFKKQDMTVFPLVYSQFGKLISFYSRKLSYEDSASDLTVFLIELYIGYKL